MELAAAFVLGGAVLFSVFCVAAARGGVPHALVRLVRILIPDNSKDAFDRSMDELTAAEDEIHCGFSCYAERRDHLASAFAEAVDRLKTNYPDTEIVVAVHPWELAMVESMAQVTGGRLYGRYELVEWDEPDCEVITRGDKRHVRRASPRARKGAPGNGSNGTKS